MENYSLAEGLYVFPTPAGAFNTASKPQSDLSVSFLRKLLMKEVSPKLTLDCIQDLADINDTEKAMQFLHGIQQTVLIQGLVEPIECSKAPLEELLPGLLKGLSDNGKVLLADSHGFYLASHGFNHEAAEELAALSADLANLQERSTSLLTNNLGLNSSAWAAVDSAGNSKIGFWPLYVGKQRFVLVISGIPRLNNPDLVTLIWTLYMRYANMDL